MFGFSSSFLKPKSVYLHFGTYSSININSWIFCLDSHILYLCNALPSFAVGDFLYKNNTNSQNTHSKAKQTDGNMKNIMWSCVSTHSSVQAWYDGDTWIDKVVGSCCLLASWCAGNIFPTLSKRFSLNITYYT